MTTASTHRSFVGFASGASACSRCGGASTPRSSTRPTLTAVKHAADGLFDVAERPPMRLRSTRVTGAGSEYTRRADDPRGHPSDRRQDIANRCCLQVASISGVTCMCSTLGVAYVNHGGL